MLLLLFGSIWSISIELCLLFGASMEILTQNTKPIPIKTLVIRIHLICVWNSVQLILLRVALPQSFVAWLCFTSLSRVYALKSICHLKELKDQSRFRRAWHFFSVIWSFKNLFNARHRNQNWKSMITSFNANGPASELIWCGVFKEEGALFVKDMKFIA